MYHSSLIRSSIFLLSAGLYILMEFLIPFLRMGNVVLSLEGFTRLIYPLVVPEILLERNEHKDLVCIGMPAIKHVIYPYIAHSQLLSLPLEPQQPQEEANKSLICREVQSG